jgi:hypothetical protein
MVKGSRRSIFVFKILAVKLTSDPSDASNSATEHAEMPNAIRSRFRVGLNIVLLSINLLPSALLRRIYNCKILAEITCSTFELPDRSQGSSELISS